MCQISLILIKKRFCIKSIQSWISCWSKSVFCVDWKWREKRVCSLGGSSLGPKEGQNNFPQSPTWGGKGTRNQGKIFWYNTSTEKKHFLWKNWIWRKIISQESFFLLKSSIVKKERKKHLLMNLLSFCLFLQSVVRTMRDNWMRGEYGNWPAADLPTIIIGYRGSHKSQIPIFSPKPMRNGNLCQIFFRTTQNRFLYFLTFPFDFHRRQSFEAGLSGGTS